MKHKLFLIFAVLYITSRFLADYIGFTLPLYGFYITDTLFGIIIAFFYLHDLFKRPIVSTSLCIATLCNFLLGISVYLGSEYLHIRPPFDFHSKELILFLLLIGPITEELLFRCGLWLPFEKAINQKTALIFSSLTFSLFHFTVIFNTDNSIRSFIIYQTIYVFFASLYWGFLRIKGSSFIYPLLAHILFNAGFFTASFLPSSQAASSPLIKTIVVVDLSFDQRNLKKLYNPKNLEVINYDEPIILDQTTCDKNIHLVEEYLALSRGEKTTLQLSTTDADAIKQTLYAIHGAHITGILAEFIPEWSIVHLGFSPTQATDLKDIQRYIDLKIKRPLATLREELHRLKPSLVQMAFSETYEENFADLKQYYSKEQAHEYALNIMSVWREEWIKTLNALQDTYFISSLGNGGIDGQGDKVAPDSLLGPLPAVLKVKNLISVTSTTQAGCLSSFANYPAQIAILGEKIESWSLCSKKPRVGLDGTSQASALVTAYFAKLLEEGNSLQMFLSQEKGREGCLKNKASTVIDL